MTGRSPPLRIATARLAGFLLLALAFAAAAMAAGAPRPDGTAEVTLSAAAVTPAEALVAAGGRVRWRNAGASPRQVTSDTGAFAAFALAPGATHDVSFAQPGRFPYSVDRTLKGVVVVEAGAGAAAPQQQPPAGAAAQPQVELLHYAVKLTAVAHHRSSTEGTEPSLDDTQVEWTGTWPDVAVHLYRTGNQIWVQPADATGAAGEITVSLNYHQVTPGSRGHECSGGFGDRSYPAKLFLHAASGGNPAALDVHAGTRGPAGPSDPALRAEAGEQCHNTAPVWPGRRIFPAEGGTTFEFTPQTLAVSVWRHDTAQLFAPLGLLLAHQPFTLSTGEQREDRDEPRRTWHEDWKASVEFMPQ